MFVLQSTEKKMEEFYRLFFAVHRDFLLPGQMSVPLFINMPHLYIINLIDDEHANL